MNVNEFVMRYFLFSSSDNHLQYTHGVMLMVGLSGFYPAAVPEHPHFEALHAAVRHLSIL